MSDRSGFARVKKMPSSGKPEFGVRGHERRQRVTLAGGRAASCRSGACAAAERPRWTGSFSRPPCCSPAAPSPARCSYCPRRVARSSGSPARKGQAPPPIPQRCICFHDHVSVSISSHQFPSPQHGTNAHCSKSLSRRALHCRKSAGRNLQEPLQNCHAHTGAVKLQVGPRPRAGRVHLSFADVEMAGAAGRIRTVNLSLTKRLLCR
jgi:hypothetical protein